MRRRRAAAAAIAAATLLLAACAQATDATQSAETTSADGASAAEADRAPVEVQPTVAVDGDVAVVTTAESTWRIDVLEARPVSLDEVSMYDGAADAEPPADGSQVAWVCVEATQLAGDEGAWLSDAVRIEVWATDAGPRYDELTGFDYEPAGDALDVYEASGNAIGEPYVRVCPIFVVPTDVDVSTIAIVPTGGEPVLLTL